MSIDADTNYSEYYRKQAIKVYPSEFVIRAFLGNYPKHHFDRAGFVGRRVLDLGFGDGRNLPLLADLGMEVHGVEVTQEICDLVTQRMANAGIRIEARVGRNCALPYPDAHFDFVLASSACYYMDPGRTYDENVREIARILKPDGWFVHSLPMPTTFIMEAAKDLGAGHMEITQDPYGVRVGAILKKFDDPAEIESYLAPQFCNIRIGSCRDDFWGSKVHLWLVAAQRKPDSSG